MNAPDLVCLNFKFIELENCNSVSNTKAYKRNIIAIKPGKCKDTVLIMVINSLQRSNTTARQYSGLRHRGSATVFHDNNGGHEFVWQKVINISNALLCAFLN